MNDLALQEAIIQSISQPQSDFLATLTIQVIVRAEDRIAAAIDAKDMAHELIARSVYFNDPMNGAIIESVEPWGGSL